MFHRCPLDEFQKKLQIFIADFHSQKLTDSHKQSFKKSYRELSEGEKRTIHLEVKVRTMGVACATPNLISTGLQMAFLLYTVALIGTRMNIHRFDPISGEHIIDTHLGIGVASLLVVWTVAKYNQSNYENLRNKPAHLAALELFDEVAREKINAELKSEPSAYTQ